MSWFGKLACGFIGFRIFGLPGLLLGAFLGHLVDEDDPIRQIPHTARKRFRGGVGNFFSSEEEKHQVFFLSVFSMLSKIAKIDGNISAAEIEAVQKFMTDDLNLDPDRLKFAKDIFRAARASDKRFEAYAADFYRVFRHQPVILENLLEILSRVCLADGQLHPEEERLLAEAARIFQLPQEMFSRIKNRRQVRPDRHYEILGCTKETPIAEIKKRYRKLALANHPDRVLKQGQSKEFAKLANEKFHEIQEAYETVKAEKGF